MTRTYHWADLTQDRLGELADEDPVVILVLGAIEQHGRHLPLSTDLDIGLGLQQATLDALLARQASVCALCLPPLAVGASDEHASYPGTLSLPAPLAIATLEAYGDSIAHAGLRRLLLLNSHGGNKAVMDLAALTLRRRHAMLVVKATYTRLAPPPNDWLPTEELRHGLHGGALETAIMLHLAPHKVEMSRAGHPQTSAESLAAAGKAVGPEGEASFAWLAEDLHADGVAGNATLADAALGERLVAHYAERLAEIVIETQQLTLPGSAP
ncbi:creatinine amidohydrolase [Franzmannia pantelleriensis]|uniref:Creatinine amidohydrolase n=1 Tax=Franzmannia pantelleriensis TaxID=48727 RepID=A0A1G9G7X1_9GAMM|nr:creatininase family protein [Halomonas pantelleriensis]SDK96868.1 creatinine amidohydrolase [Halomonas pantelleriensis]